MINGKMVKILSLFIVVIIILGYIIINNAENEKNHRKLNLKLNIENFAVYYGSIVNNSIINYLNKYNLVILQPDTFSPSNLTNIHSIKIAYIDLGEFDGTILGNCTINVSKISIGYDTNWNQTIVNVSSNLWQRHIYCMVNQSLKEGFNGVLFDDLDVVEGFPWEFNSFVNIIKNVSNIFPDAIIGVNRGFILIPSIANHIDFVLYEDFGSFYNFTTNSYEKLNGSQLENLSYRINMITNLRLGLLGLGYSPSQTNYLFAYDQSLAENYQIPIYVSDLNLSSLWNQ